ncbi:lipopolysaccharide biosynthesis protein [Patescibacteria group bacterium]|nr:MAG: lipopolysaccharide biosynthesis protein [Patescibacteria group bacterium]
MSSAKPPELTLRQKAVKGVFWIGFVTIGAKILSVITTLILARLLVPEDFGLVAVAGIVMNALTIFTDLGLGTAIVHSKHDRDKVGSTALVMMPAIATFLYIITFIFAPSIATALGSSEATNIIRILAINLLFTSLSIVPSALMEKDMAFKRKVVPELVPILVYVVVAISLAAFTQLGAYSIVFGQLSQGAAAFILYWAVSSWRPVWRFSTEVAKELIGYGKHVLGGSLLLFATTNLDNVFVSRILGVGSLGFYTLAYSIANMPATHVADVLGRVLFPALVQMNDDFERMRKNYIRSLKVLVFFTFPLLAGLAAIAPIFVPVVLGEKWMPMTAALSILAVFGAIRVLSGATGSLLLAMGKPRVIFYTGITGLILQVFWLSYFLFYHHFGVAGAALAVSIGSMMNALIVFGFVQAFMQFSYSRIGLNIGRWVIPSLIMLIVVYGLAITLQPSVTVLISLVGLGVALYLGSFVIINGKKPLVQIVNIARHKGRGQLDF